MTRVRRPRRANLRRNKVDLGRLRVAMSGPGADPRSWIALGRIDDDPDALQWIPGTGWVADVTLTSGEQAGEGPIPCRVASTFGDSAQGRLEPVARGAEVVVCFPSGDPNDQPVILGVLFAPGGNPVPTSVNGLANTEALVLAAHVLVTARDVRWQAGALVQLAAQAVELAQANATQPFVRGEAQRATLDTFLEALRTWSAAVAGALSTAGFPIAAAQAAFAGPLPVPNAIDATKNGLASALSTRIRGE